MRRGGAILATNPPFGRSGLLDPFIERTMSLLDSGHLSAAVLLQRVDATGTDGRADVFTRAVAEFTCCWRVRWIPGTTGQPRWWFAWFVWLPGRAVPPVNTRIRKSELHTLT
jgi:hypothetical protein